MQRFVYTCLATVALTVTTHAEGIATLRQLTINGLASFSNADIVDRLDATGGEVLSGQFQSIDPAVSNPSWEILWNSASGEIEISRNGTPVTDLVQSWSQTKVDFEGSFQGAIPQLAGTIWVDTSDHLFIEVSDVDGGFLIELDENNDIQSAERCLCTTPNGGFPTATCSDKRCKALDNCGPPNNPGSKYCNFRTVIFDFN